MDKVKKYLSLIKFSHTIFALPFAMIGFFLAAVKFNYGFEPIQLVRVVMAMVFARSAAMAFNRWLDKNFDAKNPRTAIREIPAGILKANSVLLFVILNCVFFFLACYYINPICFALSPIAISVILFYSYTKRFTALCHFFLGLGLSLAPIGSFLALSGKFELLPILFSVAVLCWVSGFDIIYALQDVDFDKEHQLHSIPVKLGNTKALNVSRLLHVVAFVNILLAFFVGQFGVWYLVGMIVFGILLLFQHYLVKPNDLSKVNMAFFTTNGIASIVFASFVIIDIFYNK